MTDQFWAALDAQLAELRTATTADAVLEILSQERNPYGPGSSSADGFCADSGGDASMMQALEEAGWEVTWSKATYHYGMRAPNGDQITYVEGDIYRVKKPGS